MTTHFRIHDERRWKRKHEGGVRKVWTRWALCEKGVPDEDTYVLRADVNVECGACMVVKDAWLEQPRRKPLTLRRLRALVRGLKRHANAA